MAVRGTRTRFGLASTEFFCSPFSDSGGILLFESARFSEVDEIPFWAFSLIYKITCLRPLISVHFQKAAANCRGACRAVFLPYQPKAGGALVQCGEKLKVSKELPAASVGVTR